VSNIHGAQTFALTKAERLSVGICLEAKYLLVPLYGALPAYLRIYAKTPLFETHLVAGCCSHGFRPDTDDEGLVCFADGAAPPFALAPELGGRIFAHDDHILCAAHCERPGVIAVHDALHCLDLCVGVVCGVHVVPLNWK